MGCQVNKRETQSDYDTVRTSKQWNMNILAILNCVFYGVTKIVFIPDTYKITFL